MAGRDRDRAMKIAREQILDHAAALFRAKGYAGASIDEIATACGITKGSLYHHFDGKEALALAAMAQVHDHFRVHIFSLVEQAANPGLAELKAFNRAVEDFFATRPDGCLLANLAMETGAEGGMFGAPIRAYFDQWRACYARVLAARFDAAEADHRAELWLAGALGCLTLRRVDPAINCLGRWIRSIEASLG
jgi:AcrR family transcriptional regulator